MSDILTVKEVADFLRIGLSTVYEMVDSGQLPCFRYGKHKGRIRIPRSSVDALLTLPEKTKPAPAAKSSPVMHFNWQGR